MSTRFKLPAKVTPAKTARFAAALGEKSIGHDIRADETEDRQEERYHRRIAFRLARASDYLEERAKRITDNGRGHKNLADKESKR